MRAPDFWKLPGWLLALAAAFWVSIVFVSLVLQVQLFGGVQKPAKESSALALGQMSSLLTACLVSIAASVFP